MFGFWKRKPKPTETWKTIFTTISKQQPDGSYKVVKVIPGDAFNDGGAAIVSKNGWPTASTDSK